jgi:hypothetical protein
MYVILEAIDQLIQDCAKRDLVPSAEVIDALLDLRNVVENENVATPTLA